MYVAFCFTINILYEMRRLAVTPDYSSILHMFIV